MKVELTNSMANVVQEIVMRTPDQIKEMSIEEIEKHAKVARKRNKLFYKLFSFPMFASRNGKNKFSSIVPRGSMIAAHHRFLYREYTNRKIRKIR